MKKKIHKVVYIVASIFMVVGQLGITQVFAETISKDDAKQEETQVYHDYEAYQKALKEYDEKYVQYEKDMDEYNQKKQEHDDAQAEADRVEKENAEKKAAYEQALEQYQKDLDEYNNKQQEVDDHSAKGQYIGPSFYTVLAQIESYLANYSAMNQMINSGLSINGEALISKIKENMANDPITGNPEIESNGQKVIDQWNIYAEFEKTIYGTTPSMGNISTIFPNAIGGAWYDGFKGVEFYHTFNSTTGQTVDNVPPILDHPTEDNIKQALTDLFTKTGGLAFDAANQQMDKDTFMVDQGLVNKWSSALEEAKNQGLSLYTTAIQQYIKAFETYNSSNYETADFNAFMDAIDTAAETQRKAMNLIGGMNDVDLEDGDNSAPFYNDLKNLSASDLANKYGYLKLLSNMASEATYGYFHLLTPEPGEVISVATASSWSNSYSTFGRSQGDYTPKLTPPTEPTPPTYETVPVVPDEPVAPIPPIKPVYEPLNNVSLLKVDKETKEPLANAKFELENIDNKEVLGTFTTGNDGLLEINDLNPGTYTLTEIESPEGYVLDNTPVSFIIHGTENEKIQLEKSNISTTGSVELTKVDEKTNTALQGAVFEIRDSNGSIVRSALQTNLEGKILVDGLKSGEYSFVETKAPTGYVLDNTPIKFTIEKDQQEVVKVSIKNKLMPGGVVLSKTDATTGETLQGAVFELQDKDGKALQSGLITDNSGKLAIDGLEPGNYQLVETKAPTGYDLDQTPVKFAIEKGQTEAVQVSMTNKLTPGGVVLSKTDAKTGEALQGAVFELQDKDGKAVQSGLTTDGAGKLAVDGLEPGDYQLVETQAPTGYDLDATPVTFTIEKGQREAVQVSMTNKLTSGGVVLSKVDAKTGEALQGAVFELQDKDGKSLQSGLTTDESGKLAVDGLEPGDYQLVETQAPTGYDLDATPVTFTIEKGQREAVQVSMTNKLTPGGVVLSKVDAKTGEALQGAVFELQDKDGKSLQSGLTTDKSGKLAVDGLEPGDYQLVETQAPTGYDLDAMPVTFTIEKGQKEAVQVSMTNKLTPGGVVLSKTDAKTGEALQGAVFELQDTEGKSLQSGLTTDETGKLAIDGLDPGDYQLVETQAPTGYDLDATPVTFTIEKGQREAVQVSMTNKLTSGGVVLSKVDAKTGEALQGAVFELQDKDGKSLQSGLTTDESGKLAVDGLEPGDYQLVETQAPTGYDLDATPVTFTIEKGQREAVQVSMTNKLTPGGVVLSKVDAKTGEALQGAVFELQDKDGKSLQSGLTTDKSGKLAVDGLEPGDYQLVETQAPTGYDLDATPVTFTIEKGQKEAVQVSMTNKLTPGGVVLSKTDAKTGEALQGAVFELQDTEGKSLQSGLTTDETGKLAIDGLDPGDYQLVETQAPTGYDLDATPVTFTIEKGQREAVQVSMTNKLTSGGVVLSKVNAKTGEALQGAVFELQDKDGKSLQSGLTTDESGKLAVDGLEPGDYQLVETQAPTGYDLDATPVTFTIEKGQTEAIQVTKTNQPTVGSVVLTKIDSKTGDKLAGAIFELRDSNNKVVLKDLVTDSNGKLAINDLKPGDYQLIETQAPTGYVLDATPIEFVVKSDKSSQENLTKTNKGQEKSVRIEKRDSRTNELLSGAKFKLLDSKGKTIKEDITTDKNGVATIKGLEEGTYQLIETQAPKGYVLDKTATRFTVEKDSSLITLTKLNTKKTDPTDSDKTNNPSNSGQSSSTYSPKSYPKTGEKSSVWITVIGVIIVVLIGAAWFVKKRR